MKSKKEIKEEIARIIQLKKTVALSSHSLFYSHEIRALECVLDEKSRF